MRIIADFHIHSKYSRATSRDMDLPTINQWAKYKGIKLMGTGDFTHPFWLQELKRHLSPAGDGFYEYDGTYYFLTSELNCIYHKNGKPRRVHNLVVAPSFEIVEKINHRLSTYGNLLVDGRPILNLDCEDLVKMITDISDRCMIIPAHAWTPHFSVFGSNSGFNRLIDCFGSQIKNVHAIETGLSSDPSMNWRLSFLDTIALLSNSDAHSPSNIGREANVFDVKDYTGLYNEITEIIKSKDDAHFLYTIEFFPEEGKYHFDGHKNCEVNLHPQVSIEGRNLCPVCNKPLTIGVLHRVEELSDKQEGYQLPNAVPCRKIIPLEEIIAEALNLNKGASQVRKEYLGLVGMFGSEFKILLDLNEQELSRIQNMKIARNIIKMRTGAVAIVPGYDGVYGTIIINNSETANDPLAKLEQLSFF
ncbi:MAG: endonuclease Q family protein [Elusimicrobia bacterium]|nr:endonuclease Q family protein [Elusimicrobiota bacterium]